MKKNNTKFKVFGIGLSRTGTTSLGTALNQLGIKTIHYPHDETLAGIEEIDRRYQFHCRSARAIAQEYFAANKVLLRLLDLVMG